MNKLLPVVAAIAAIGCTTAVQAASTTFVAVGNETIKGIDTMVWGPMNVLAAGGNQANANFNNSSGQCTGSGGTECNFDVFGHASLAAFQGGSPTATLPSTVGTNYQVTMQFGFQEKTASLTPTGNGAVATFDFVADKMTDGSDNFFQLYYDTSLTANALQGAGFGDGFGSSGNQVLIMSGQIEPVGAFASSFNAVTTSPVNIGGESGTTATPWLTFQGGAPQQTVTGNGGTGTLDLLSITPNYVNTDYFPNGVESFRLDSIFQGVPFSTVDPSLRFPESFKAGDGSLLATDLGLVNGGLSFDVNGVATADGPDILLQSSPDSPISSAVPEPGSLALLGIGFAAMGGIARRKRGSIKA